MSLRSSSWLLARILLVSALLVPSSSAFAGECDAYFNLWQSFQKKVDQGDISRFRDADSAKSQYYDCKLRTQKSSGSTGPLTDGETGKRIQSCDYNGKFYADCDDARRQYQIDLDNYNKQSDASGSTSNSGGQTRWQCAGKIFDTQAEAQAHCDSLNAAARAKSSLDAKAAAELKAKQEAEAKAAAELKAKQEAEAKAAAELKAKQEAEAKAAAELKAKQEAEAKAAREAKVAADIKAKEVEQCAANQKAAQIVLNSISIFREAYKTAAISIPVYTGYVLLIDKMLVDSAPEYADAQTTCPREASALDLERGINRIVQYVKVDVQIEVKRALEAEAAAKAEADARAKAEADARATESKSIVCVKGKSSLKVSGKNPKCPTGYKKKK